jgi:hypothetical protein
MAAMSQKMPRTYVMRRKMGETQQTASHEAACEHLAAMLRDAATEVPSWLAISEGNLATQDAHAHTCTRTHANTHAHARMQTCMRTRNPLSPPTFLALLFCLQPSGASFTSDPLAPSTRSAPLPISPFHLRSSHPTNTQAPPQQRGEVLAGGAQATPATTRPRSAGLKT